MVSKVKIVDVAVLKKMHTGSLMSRRKALLKCEDSISGSDRDDDYVGETGFIEFKQTTEWQMAYADLISVLNGRENWRPN